MAKRICQSIDDVRKFIGASSTSKLVGKRVLALAAERHEMSSPFIAAQEKTRSDVRGQENPGQASGDRLRLPRCPGTGTPAAKGYNNLNNF